MTDIPNSLPDHHGSTLLAAPDTEVDAREVFGVDIDMKVPAFSEADERVPDLDPAYVFDGDTTLAILAGFKFNRRVMVQGYHGTGKSTHIEQVRSEEHTSELQSLMRRSYAVFCLKTKKRLINLQHTRLKRIDNNTSYPYL